MKQFVKGQSSRNRCQSSGWAGLNSYTSALPAIIYKIIYLQDCVVLAMWVLYPCTSARAPTTHALWYWTLLLSVTASAGLCKVMMIGKRGHSFSVTWLNSDSFWLKHTDLFRDCFFYRLRGSIDGWVLMGVVPGQRGALLCRRRVFVLSHIWGSDQLRELCREQDCPAGCHCRKAIRQNCGNTVSVPQPGGNKWVSLTPICKT